MIPVSPVTTATAESMAAPRIQGAPMTIRTCAKEQADALHSSMPHKRNIPTVQRAHAAEEQRSARTPTRQSTMPYSLAL